MNDYKYLSVVTSTENREPVLVTFHKTRKTFQMFLSTLIDDQPPWTDCTVTLYELTKTQSSNYLLAVQVGVKHF